MHEIHHWRAINFLDPTRGSETSVTSSKKEVTRRIPVVVVFWNPDLLQTLKETQKME
jgi:hypothetical protein